MNYFFGQTGNAPADAAMGMSAPVAVPGVDGITPSGRDVVQSPPPSGLMAGKRGADGSSATFDMKSLGKHIEAVSFLVDSR